MAGSYSYHYEYHGISQSASTSTFRTRIAFLLCTVSGGVISTGRRCTQADGSAPRHRRGPGIRREKGRSHGSRAYYQEEFWVGLQEIAVVALAGLRARVASGVRTRTVGVLTGGMPKAAVFNAPIKRMNAYILEGKQDLHTTARAY